MLQRRHDWRFSFLCLELQPRNGNRYGTQATRRSSIFFIELQVGFELMRETNHKQTYHTLLLPPKASRRNPVVPMSEYE